MSEIAWPERFTPGTTDNYVSNEAIVAGLTAAEVWPYLNSTAAWPTYYGNVSDIRFHDSSGPELQTGARFRFTTFGLAVEAEVTEYEPPANGKPARVAWHGWVEGSAETALDVHHAWLIEDLPGGRVRILTQETQLGAPAQELARTKPNPMLNAHQEWIDGLAAAAKRTLVLDDAEGQTFESGRPQEEDTNRSRGGKGITTLSRWMSGASFHIGMSVPDLQAALDFYVGLLGFEEAWRKTDVDMSAVSGVPDLRARAVAQLLVPGGSRIELQEFDPAGPVVERTLSGSGLNHLSFGVQDIHAEYERLKAAGVEFIGDPIALDLGPDDNLTGWSVVYLKGPWGVMLELFGPTPGYEGSVDDDERRPAS